MNKEIEITGEPKLDLIEIAKSLDQDKAQDLLLLDLTGVNSYLSYFLIATALSPLHLKKLADSLRRSNLKKEYSIVSSGGSETESGWLILDFGPFIIHLFTKEKRELYNLEELWAKAESIEWNR